MYYRANTDNPMEYFRTVYFSDDRSPGELSADIAGGGYLLVVRGEVMWATANIGGVTAHSFEFTPKGQTVLLRDHVIRIDLLDENDPNS